MMCKKEEKDLTASKSLLLSPDTGVTVGAASKRSAGVLRPRPHC